MTTVDMAKADPAGLEDQDADDVEPDADDGDDLESENDDQAVAGASGEGAPARPGRLLSLRGGAVEAGRLLQGWPVVLRNAGALVPDVVLGSAAVAGRLCRWVTSDGELLPRLLLSGVGFGIGAMVYSAAPVLVVYGGGTGWLVLALVHSPRMVKRRKLRGEVKAAREKAELEHAKKRAADLVAAERRKIEAKEKRAAAPAARPAVPAPAAAPAPAPAPAAGPVVPEPPAKPAGPDPEQQRQAFMDLLYGYLRPEPHRVHLVTLVEFLHSKRATGWDVSSLRRQYESYGVVVADQVWIAGGKNRAGIKLEDQRTQPVWERPAAAGEGAA